MSARKIEYSIENGQHLAKFKIADIAYDKFGNKIDMTIIKVIDNSTLRDESRIAVDHVFAFLPLVYNKNKDDLFAIAQKIERAGNINGRYNDGKYPFQISLKPSNFVPSMKTVKWADAIEAMLKEIVLENKYDSGVLEQLKTMNILFIGLGGTGSYICEHISNMEVRSLSLVDFDKLESKNLRRYAFGPTPEDEGKFKVEFINEKIKWKNNDIYIYQSKIEDFIKINTEIKYDFCFISVDCNEARKSSIDYCTANSIPYIDSGMTVDKIHNGQFSYSLRSSFDDKTSEFKDEGNQLYKKNIQISELNAMNAMQSVIMFKEYFKIYTKLDIEEYKTIKNGGSFSISKE